MGQLLKNSYTK